jgi:hypothetical protein
MHYKIVKAESLQKSLTRYQILGDSRWRLFDALLTSTTKEEFLSKAAGFNKRMISQRTGDAWYVTAQNHFDYVERNGRIVVIDD